MLRHAQKIQRARVLLRRHPRPPHLPQTKKLFSFEEGHNTFSSDGSLFPFSLAPVLSQPPRTLSTLETSSALFATGLNKWQLPLPATTTTCFDTLYSIENSRDLFFFSIPPPEKKIKERREDGRGGKKTCLYSALFEPVCPLLSSSFRKGVLVKDDISGSQEAKLGPELK